MDADTVSSIKLQRVMEEYNFKETCINYEKGNENVKKVVNTWNRLSDSDVGVGAYALMIAYFTKLKKRRTAYRLLSEMKNRNLQLSVSIFNSKIKLLQVRRHEPQWKELSLIFKEMNNLGMVPDNRTYTTTLQCCTFWKHGDAAVRVLRLMKELEMPISSMLLATAAACLSDVHNALRLITTFPPEISYNVIVFNAVMTVSSRSGDVDSCWKTFRTMLHHKQKPTIRTFHILLNAHKEARDLEGCLRVLELIKKNNFTLDEVGYTIIVRLCNLLLYEKGEHGTPNEVITAIAKDIYLEAARNKQTSSLRLHRELSEIFKDDPQMLKRIDNESSFDSSRYLKTV